MKIKGAVAKNLRGKTDWKKLIQLTDSEIIAAVATDPDTKIIKNEKVGAIKSNEQAASQKT